jgi:enterochelin esterase-like enzyme
VTLAIKELEERHGLSGGDVEAFLAERSFPIVEGSSITIVFRGQVDSVALRHWIQGLPAEQPLERLAGTDLWFLVLDLPAESRMEYKLQVTERGQTQLICDPLNPHLANDPYGANTVVHAEGYEIPAWTLPDPEARAGSVEDLTILSTALGGPRPIKVYVPARYREERRYPLVVMHDGGDFLRFANLQTVLDNLIHRLEIAPMIVAFIDSSNRIGEYADDENHARFLVEELIPGLEERFPIVPSPSARGLVGASFGAVASLSAAWRNPGFFGNLFLLSGSFAFTDIGEHDNGPMFDPVVGFVNAFRAAPGRPAERIFVTCGMYEGPIYYNRSMVPLLQSTGMDVRYVEARDGHNWENWRDRMREGLSWLFPGPLWMVYE